MTKKVSCFDRRILQEYCTVISLLCAVVSVFSIMFGDALKQNWDIAIVVYIVMFLIPYIVVYIRANFLAYGPVQKRLGNVILHIEYGDIFRTEGLKAIQFNEYFDTIVDGELISENSLNGAFLSRNDISPEEVADSVTKDKRIEKYRSGYNNSRIRGNKEKYELGTIHRYKDYLLVAFSRFDEENHAYITLNEYFSTLVNFWKQVRCVYNAEKCVSVSLMGNGITTVTGGEHLKPEDLLNLMVLTLSHTQGSLADGTHVRIVLYENMENKINLYSFWGKMR